MPRIGRLGAGSVPLLRASAAPSDWRAETKEPEMAIPSSDAQPQRLLYTVTETLRLLNIGRTKFYQLVNGGDLTTVKIGDKRLVSADALAEFIRRCTD